MSRLTLTEYTTLSDVALTAEQFTALRGLDPAPLAIAPGRIKPERYDLSSGSYVGVIRTGDLEIELRPKLLISRLLFLLSYSMDPDNWPRIHAEFEQRESILEAIIPGFVYQVRLALRRGVLQGYRTQEDALINVRGRIRTSEQIRRRYGLAPPIELRFDEFTEDIEENRLIKAAIHRLTRLPIRSNLIRQSLREFDIALQHVSLVEYPPYRMPNIVYTRLNERYKPAVELAKLILRATSFDLGPGTVAASAFLIDMNVVFEKFVERALNDALRAHGTTLSAQDRRLHLDDRGVIDLVPDISCWHAGAPTFVGDIKYKRTDGNRGTNPDLYQLLAYCVAADITTGMLIYAKGEAELVTHTVRHVGTLLKVVAIDLERSPSDILHHIQQIASQIADTSRKSASFVASAS